VATALPQLPLHRVCAPAPVAEFLGGAAYPSTFSHIAPSRIAIGTGGSKRSGRRELGRAQRRVRRQRGPERSRTACQTFCRRPPDRRDKAPGHTRGRGAVRALGGIRTLNPRPLKPVRLPVAARARDRVHRYMPWRRALGEIRTHTGGVLNAVPLPLGYEGWECEKPPRSGIVPGGRLHVRR
jgi:hypothetical protein